MKKLNYFLLSFIVTVLFVSCNNKSTDPGALDDIKNLAGKYCSIVEGDAFNNVTIKDDGSLFVEYNNGDGAGNQNLTIVPNNIVENKENIYNLHYTAQDGTGEERFVTLIAYDTHYIKLIGWQTKSSGFLCNEANLNDKSGIEAYAGKYVYLKDIKNPNAGNIDPNNTITIGADGTITFKESAQSSEIITNPGFTTLGFKDVNKDMTYYTNYIFPDRSIATKTLTDNTASQSVKFLHIVGKHGYKRFYIEEGVIQ